MCEIRELKLYEFGESNQNIYFVKGKSAVDHCIVTIDCKNLDE